MYTVNTSGTDTYNEPPQVRQQTSRLRHFYLEEAVGTKVRYPKEGTGIRCAYKFLSILFILGPDPHSQCESGPYQESQNNGHPDPKYPESRKIPLKILQYKQLGRVRYQYYARIMC